VSHLIGLEVFHAATLPEPSTYALFVLGLLVMGSSVRRQRRAVRAAGNLPASTHAVSTHDVDGAHP